MNRIMGWEVIVTMLASCLAVATTHAAQSGSIIVPADNEGQWVGDPDGAYSDPDTGIRIHNYSAQEEEVFYNWNLDDDCDGMGTVPDGFVLLDGTLTITTAIPDGSMRLQVRREIDRARARQLGLRERELTLFRLKPRVAGPAVWRPIVQRIRERMGPGKARKIPNTADFMLGHYGVALTDHYVWGVIDVPGTYAVGMPEPTTLLCLAGGAALLLSNRRRRV